MSFTLAIKVVSASGLVLAILPLALVLRRTRSEPQVDHSLAERINGMLGADGRRLADVLVLVDRTRDVGLSTKLHVSGSVRTVPAKVDIAGYRIVQAALTNAAERGNDSATVVIGYQTGAVTVTVDTPIGSRPGQLLWMQQIQERVASVGGTVETGLYQGGWRVRACLPTVPRPA